MDVQCEEGSTCVTEVCHGQADHARGCIPHIERVLSKTTLEEEGTLAKSSFLDQVI